MLSIIQARGGSTRLPGKIFKDIQGLPLLSHVIRRAQRVKGIDTLLVATTLSSEDDMTEEISRREGIGCYRGSTDDVLDRYYQASLLYPEHDSIMRITGDCPLLDPAVVEQVVQLYQSGTYEYVSNVNPPTFPDGLDVEVFSKKILHETWREATLPSEREHVTLFMRNSGRFRCGNVESTRDYSSYRFTVDDVKDLEVVRFLIEHAPKDASFLDYITVLDQNPDIKMKNAAVKRNEGLEKSLRDDQKK